VVPSVGQSDRRLLRTKVVTMFEVHNSSACYIIFLESNWEATFLCLCVFFKFFMGFYLNNVGLYTEEKYLMQGAAFLFFFFSL